MPPTFDDPTARNEGTAAHWVITHAFETGTKPDDYLNQKAPNGVIITNGILKHVAEYFSTITREAEQAAFYGCEGDASFDEVRARFDNFSFDGFALRVRDFKFGYRIVEPRDNWTLIAYAIGLCINNGFTPDHIVLAIHQPRVPHPEGTVREWRMSYAELQNRYEVLSYRLKNPDIILHTGPHCEKCKNATVCPALRTATFNAVDVSMTAHAEEIADQQIAQELAILDAAEKRLKSRKKQLEDLAVYRMRKGSIIDGYAMERQLSNRAWNEGLTPEFLSAVLGMTIARTEAITPTQAIAAGANEQAVNSLSDRKETGLKLSRISANKMAEKLFGKVKG